VLIHYSSSSGFPVEAGLTVASDFFTLGLLLSSELMINFSCGAIDLWTFGWHF
jgi:hypothetical protein